MFNVPSGVLAAVGDAAQKDVRMAKRKKLLEEMQTLFGNLEGGVTEAQEMQHGNIGFPQLQAHRGAVVGPLGQMNSADLELLKLQQAKMQNPMGMGIGGLSNRDLEYLRRQRGMR